MIKRFADWLAATLLLAVVWLRLGLSERGAERLARGCASLVRVALRSRRRVVMRNLRRAFGPARPEAELDRIMRDAYFHGVIGFFDLLPLFRLSREEWLKRIEVTGESHLREALARGKGVIAVSAHYGSFPMLGAAVPGLGIPFAFLYRKPKAPKTRKLFDDWLEAAGCAIVEDAPRHLAAVRVLEALSRGMVVAILVDQHFPAGVVVPFFGHPARTGVGAALLAARSGAPLVPMRMVRVGPGRWRLAIDPAMDPPADRSREALVDCTARLTARVEAWIREAPDHWFWVHRRWKDLDREEDARTGVSRKPSSP